MNTIGDLFQQAVRFHQSGHLAQAEALYRQVIQADPTHAQAVHLLGLLAHQTGHSQAALELIQRAIALNPSGLGFHFNLGMVYKGLGQLDEAGACFRQELLLNPNHVDSHNNLGIVLVSQGQVAQGIACYLQVLHLNPNHLDARNNLGIAYLYQGQSGEGIKCFREVLGFDPNNILGHINLGNALKNQGQLAEAAACFRQVLRLDPEHAYALGILGKVLQELGQTAEAVHCYRQALRINPNQSNLLNNLGIALFDQRQWAESTECFRQAVQLSPNQADAYLNLAGAFLVQGHYPQAAECYKQVLNMDPANIVARWNRSHIYLLQGDFTRGWQDFELRWIMPGAVPPTFQEPRWDGSPLEGKTILVYNEGGLGDTIQFARLLSLVQQRGGKVLFECPTRLYRLMTGIPGVNQLIPAGAPLPPFDVQVSLFSLPRLLEITLATIPVSIPYLSVDPMLVEKWKQELARESAPLKVGIVWQGTLAHRSLPLAHFEPLARVDGVRLISLQVGPGREQLATAAFPILDLGPDSLDDLAAAMINLDLVITVDTSVTHLAGALGLPVWLVLAFSPDFRWLLEREDSPWYPTARLFRQKKLDDWDGVFERIAEELKVLANASRREGSSCLQ